MLQLQQEKLQKMPVDPLFIVLCLTITGKKKIHPNITV